MLGSDIETGGAFDPLGFSKDEDALYRYRQVELKHGRVAMLAVLGVIVQNYFQLPDPVFSLGDHPQLAFAKVFAERPVAIWQIAAFASAIELTIGKQDASKAPGDFDFGAAFRGSDEEYYEKLQLKELKNGRLAMLGITGMFVQEAVSGQGPIEQTLSYF
jgi:light-harvesting complex I chlorophyll a/b binding protein 1